MSVLESSCLGRLARLCSDGCALGWHEANGGNISYRLTPEDVQECEIDFALFAEWQPLPDAVPGLAGELFLVTGSGKYLCNMERAPQECAGIIELNVDGTAWRLLWGLEADGKPTSELMAHLLCHEARRQSASGMCRIVYHAHCPQAIALSAIAPASQRIWTRILWKCLTESIVMFPQGVGILPWMCPGTHELALATRDTLRSASVCVWPQHGVIACGDTFDEAFGIVETLEKACCVYLTARAANGGDEPECMVSDQQLREICERYGLKPNLEYLDEENS